MGSHPLMSHCCHSAPDMHSNASEHLTAEAVMRLPSLGLPYPPATCCQCSLSIAMHRQVHWATTSQQCLPLMAKHCWQQCTNPLPIRYGSGLAAVMALSYRAWLAIVYCGTHSQQHHSASTDGAEAGALGSGQPIEGHPYSSSSAPASAPQCHALRCCWLRGLRST